MNTSIERAQMQKQGAENLVDFMYLEMEQDFQAMIAAIETGTYNPDGLNGFFMKLIMNIADYTGGSSLDDIRYRQYIFEMIFETMYSMYPGGKTEKEFVKTILEEEGIRIEEKELERQYRAFSKHISNVRIHQGTFEERILAYRNQHKSVGDKNKNSQQPIFNAIYPFERIEMLCRFYLRKRNRSASGNDKVRMEIERVCYSKFLCFFNSEEELEEFRADYGKYGSVPIKELDDDGLKWLEKFLDLQTSLLRYEMEQEEKGERNAALDFAPCMEYWTIRRKLEWTIIIQQKLAPEINEDELVKAYRGLGVIIRILSGKNDDYMKVFHDICNAVLLIGEDVFWGYNKEAGIAAYRIDVKRLKKLHENLRDFEPQCAIEKVRCNLINCLPDYQENGKDCVDGEDFPDSQENHLGPEQALARFIELCLCCTGIVYTDEQLCCVEKAVGIVFEFLKNCYGKKVQEGIISIAVEKRVMQEKLKPLDVKLSDFYVSSFENPEKGKSSSLNSYLQGCYNTRYIRLMNVICSLEEGESKGNLAQEIIQKFLDGILVKHGSEWKVPSSLFKEPEIPIFNKMFEAIFPNNDETYTQVYLLRDRIVQIAMEIGAAQFIGFA